MATDDTHTKPTETYEIIKATQRPLDGINIDGREMRFNQSGAFRVKDRGVAMAIGQKHRGEVTVTKIAAPAPADRGHKYFFGAMPEMPWKRKEREERERQEKQNESANRPEGASGPTKDS